MKNIYTVTGNPDREICFDLFQSDKYRIESITSMGQGTDWMQQDEDEFCLIICGSAVLEWECDGQSQIFQMKAGDSVFIPRTRRHRVVKTDEYTETRWICFFTHA